MLLASAVATLLVALAALVVLAGTGDPGDESLSSRRTRPSPSPAPGIAEIGATTLRIPRTPFCEGLATERVEDALGGAVTQSASYGNGDPVRLGAGRADVAHEYGCRWEGPQGATARAWVFVPPVTVREARRLVRSTSSTDGCQRLPGRYGAPSVGVRCAGKSRQQASYRGLFGDAWLTCTLSLPGGGPGRVSADVLVERTDRWCAAVALAASGK